jgi:hypothetical protein
MKTISDRVLAARLLKARQEGGYRFGTFVRWKAKSYVISFVYFGAVPAFCLTAWWILFALVLGMFLGMLLRDLGWVLASNRSWPLTVRVIDWVVVEELAAEEPPA